MTRISTASAFFAVALALGAGTARADGVTVNVAGRNRAELRHDIARAANQVCSAAVARDQFGDYLSIDDCVDDTVSATLQMLSHGSAGNRRR